VQNWLQIQFHRKQIELSDDHAILTNWKHANLTLREKRTRRITTVCLPNATKTTACKNLERGENLTLSHHKIYIKNISLYQREQHFQPIMGELIPKAQHQPIQADPKIKWKILLHSFHWNKNRLKLTWLSMKTVWHCFWHYSQARRSAST